MYSVNVDIQGIPIFTDDLDSLIVSIDNSSNIKNGIAYQFLSAHAVVEASSNSKLKNVLLKSTNLCDSLPLSKFLKIKYGSRIDQIRGADFMRKALQELTYEGAHFLLGGTNFNTERIIQSSKEQSGINIFAGVIEPPFDIEWTLQIEEWIKIIDQSNAKYVWVGLGAPKQFYISRMIADSLPIHCFSVGAAFDFLAGSKRECPRLISQFGFEWLFRLLQEPRRLWRRYLFGNWQFTAILFLDYLEHLGLIGKEKQKY